MYFIRRGEVLLFITRYINELLVGVPKEFSWTSATPAAHYLSNIDSEASNSDAKMTSIFHHLVAELLYLSKRAEPNQQL